MSSFLKLKMTKFCTRQKSTINWNIVIKKDWKDVLQRKPSSLKKYTEDFMLVST